MNTTQKLILLYNAQAKSRELVDVCSHIIKYYPRMMDKKDLLDNLDHGIFLLEFLKETLEGL